MNRTTFAPSAPLPNYRLEIPSHLQYLLVAGFTAGVAGLLLTFLLSGYLRILGVILLIVGVAAALLTTILFLVTNNRARLNARAKMMAAVPWRGDETVLDVGCGNGILLLTAAKYLTTGKAVGIDLWQEEAGGQNAETVWRNAEIEGVADRIELHNVDARKLSFEAATFDVVLSSLALHHMGDQADREQGLQEMMRVLKPGGQILLYDMFPMTNQAAALMRAHSFQEVQRLSGWALRVVMGVK